MQSKVNQFIVYKDGIPETVWGYEWQAKSAAVSLAHSAREICHVVFHAKSGLKQKIYTANPGETK